MTEQYLDKDGLQIVIDKVNETRQVAAGAMGLAQSVDVNTQSLIHGLLSRDVSQGISDLNNAVSPGTYVISPSISNAPINGMYGAVLVFGQKTDTPSSSSQWIWQLAVSTDNDYIGAVWLRHSINSNSISPNNWSSWRNISAGYISGMTAVDEAWDTSYISGSGSKTYNNLEGGLYKLHIYLDNNGANKTHNWLQTQLYNDNVAVCTLSDDNTGDTQGTTIEHYIRLAPGSKLVATHSADGGSSSGRCYFVLYKVIETY